MRHNKVAAEKRLSLPMISSQKHQTELVFIYQNTSYRAKGNSVTDERTQFLYNTGIIKKDTLKKSRRKELLTPLLPHHQTMQMEKDAPDLGG